MAGIVFDANLVIALFDSNNLHHSQSWSFFNRVTHEPIYLSALTYAEVLTQPSATGKLNFFATNMISAGFQIQEITEELARDIARVRADSNLKMPDACVLGLAKFLEAHLATADRQVAKAAKKYKVGVTLIQG